MTWRIRWATDAPSANAAGARAGGSGNPWVPRSPSSGLDQWGHACDASPSCADRGVWSTFLDRTSIHVVLAESRRCVKRRRLSGNLADCAQLRGMDVKPASDLVAGRFPSELSHQRAFGSSRIGEQRDHVARQADSAGLLAERMQHALADPPVHVSAEAEPAPPVEFSMPIWSPMLPS